MQLGICPYCESQGFVTVIKTVPGGVDVDGHCLHCGYHCNSDYAQHEQPLDDLLCEFNELEQVQAHD